MKHLPITACAAALLLLACKTKVTLKKSNG